MKATYIGSVNARRSYLRRLRGVSRGVAPQPNSKVSQGLEGLGAPKKPTILETRVHVLSLETRRRIYLLNSKVNYNEI